MHFVASFVVQFLLYVTAAKESDLRQVGLRRQICPHICILRHGQWQSPGWLAGWLTDSPKDQSKNKTGK